MTRKIDAPGVEFNEIDRSLYEYKADYSLVGTTVLMTGFASKGENYSVKWINTAKNLVDTYGYPENELETYFHLGALEVLNKGGVLLTAKLPYDNSSKDKYTYTTYAVLKPSESPDGAVDVSTLTEAYENVYQIQSTLRNLLILLNEVNNYEISNLFEMQNCVEDLASKYSSSTNPNANNIYSIRDSIHNIIVTLKNENTSCFTLIDLTIRKFLKILPTADSGKMSLEQFDDLKTSSRSVAPNTIKIVDISRSKYEKADVDCIKTKYNVGTTTEEEIYTNDCLGIVPVIVSPTNALYLQHLIDLAEFDNDDYPLSQYNCISGIKLVNTNNPALTIDLSKLNGNYNMNFGTDEKDDYTVSQLVTSYFPNILFIEQNKLDTTYLKQIGIVVLKMYKDKANGNKISFSVLESFIGSLDRTAKDLNTNASLFIDNIVNDKSQYINVFSNVNPTYVKAADIITITNQVATSLGFYDIDTLKIIDINNSILTPLSYILNKCKDPNQIRIDLIADAGISNVALLAASCGTSNKIDFTFYRNIVDHDENGLKWRLVNSNDSKQWNIVLKKIDEFCKYTRKDCMFIADGLRTFCLQGNQKIVRDTKLDSDITRDILPKLKYMSGINSSYTAGYCNWFLTVNPYTGENIWCPPSIKMIGVYIYTDAYYHKWDAPAGHRRGKISDVSDTAFSPNNDEAGKIYNQAWNYAVSYPMDGIIVEGQKTMQLKKTAFDRINVRRLFLYLEKQVVRIAQYFKYENNTLYQRQLFVDTIRPLFDDAINGSGIAEYAIKCDNDNNTETTIENHELICKIAVRPIKTIEFIVLDFICTNLSASITETILS